MAEIIIALATIFLIGLVVNDFLKSNRRKRFANVSKIRNVDDDYSVLGASVEEILSNPELLKNSRVKLVKAGFIQNIDKKIVGYTAGGPVYEEAILYESFVVDSNKNVYQVEKEFDIPEVEKNIRMIAEHLGIPIEGS